MRQFEIWKNDNDRFRDRVNETQKKLYSLHCEAIDAINDNWMGSKRSATTGRSLNEIFDDIFGEQAR